MTANLLLLSPKIFFEMNSVVRATTFGLSSHSPLTLCTNPQNNHKSIKQAFEL
jgi:hypothetical protein